MQNHRKDIFRTEALGFTAFAVLALTVSIPAHAQTVYTASDSGAGSTTPHPNSDAKAVQFNSAALLLGPVQVLTFETASLGAFSSLNFQNISVSGTAASIQNAPTGSPTPQYGYNTTVGGSKYVQLAGGSVTFNFNEPTPFFGAYFTGVQNTNVTLSFIDGTIQSLALPASGNGGGATFYGFTDSGRVFSSLTLNAGNDIIGVDDVSFSAAPEPSEWAAMVFTVIGLGGLLIRARRRMPSA